MNMALSPLKSGAGCVSDVVMDVTVALLEVRAQAIGEVRQRSVTSQLGEPLRWDDDEMAQSPALVRPRAQRVDARSNAERIVRVARAAFTAGETPSLEEI